MTFNHFNRRFHLYLALALLPWFAMYGISSIPFVRNSYFRTLYNDGIPQWTTRLEKAYDRPVPDTDNYRPFAKQVVQDLGLEIDGAFGIGRPNSRRLNIYLINLWHHTRITYYLHQKQIKVEDKRFRWDQFFTTLHARGGFQQDSVLNDAWAVVVDLVCIGFLLWIASGIIMWWQLSQTRKWGFLALGGGVLSFVIFLLAL